MTDRCVQALKTASARGAADRFLEEFGKPKTIDWLINANDIC